ncbi:MAG: hypothetical protein EHM78_18420 [Myxococcaceae bacterium]|nr:MAG: hypothetical protein EHM78_18420 [Myxococcaceae bacterium]
MRTRAAPPRGFVLLLVLGAAAVLSLIAAFVYTRTEDQLLLSISARGQSIASARATLAAERTLAVYRAPFGYPAAVASLGMAKSYEEAQTLGLVIATPAENYNIAGKNLSTGNGAQWCVETWKLDRGPGIAPWTVIEAFGFYGETNPKPVNPGDGFTQPGCTPQGNPRIISSHITLHLEVPPTVGGSTTTDTQGGPAGGTGAVGAG